MFLRFQNGCLPEMRSGDSTSRVAPLLRFGIKESNFVLRYVTYVRNVGIGVGTRIICRQHPRAARHSLASQGAYREHRNPSSFGSDAVAHEAADSGLLSPELAAGISRVKGGRGYQLSSGYPGLAAASHNFYKSFT